MSDSRYAVGIDLGTTHCALSYAPLAREEDEQVSVAELPVPQLTAPGTVEERALLPSFLYLPHPEEVSEADLSLAWGTPPGLVVGELARSLGTSTAIRLVASAKSWLCHPGVDRRASILPVSAPDEVPKLSPLDASVRYLEHLRDAWNHAYPDAPLSQQQVTVTVPASFDPAARELTAEATRAVGLEQLVLLEEPQAALYSWINASAGAWRKQVKVGDVILVVDVGGGTTDFSLIAVTETVGNLELHRIAVGDHILLGGDNMDLALANVVRGKLAEEGTTLDLWQLQALTHGCRAAKETLLHDPDAGPVPVVVPGRGSSLIGGTIRGELTHEDVTRTLVEGFLPIVDAGARPAARTRGALTQLGLPYAQDAGISRHLAAFLGRQLAATDELAGFAERQSAEASFLHPSALLFNGGVFKAHALSERILSIVNGWLESEGAPPVRLLEGADLDLSVARGAAYYGCVRQGRGVRIRGGTARAHYLGIESAMPAVPGMEPPIQALCVAPFGMEEGTAAELPPHEVGLVVGEPVRFRFFGSSTRREDRVGTVLSDWRAGELEELEELKVTLPAEGRAVGAIVPVRLRAAVTEVGTLELEAVPRSGEERWKVEFDVRGSEASESG